MSVLGPSSYTYTRSELRDILVALDKSPLLAVEGMIQCEASRHRIADFRRGYLFALDQMATAVQVNLLEEARSRPIEAWATDAEGTVTDQT